MNLQTGLTSTAGSSNETRAGEASESKFQACRSTADGSDVDVCKTETLACQSPNLSAAPSGGGGGSHSLSSALSSTREWAWEWEQDIRDRAKNRAPSKKSGCFEFRVAKLIQDAWLEARAHSEAARIHTSETTQPNEASQDSRQNGTSETRANPTRHVRGDTRPELVWNFHADPSHHPGKRACKFYLCRLLRPGFDWISWRM